MNYEVRSMNNGPDGKITKFTDLNSWKYGHDLALQIYKITQGFPKEEVYGLTSQIRRAAVSVTSNIAEGFSRNSYKDKTHFYTMALGSLTELQNQLLLSRDIGYLASDTFDTLADSSVITHKLINGLIKSSRAKNHTP